MIAPGVVPAPKRRPGCVRTRTGRHEDVAEWLADIEQRFGDIRFRNVYRLPLP